MWHLRQHGQRRRSTTVNAASTDSQRRSTPPATGQRRRITMVIGGQRWRSTMVAGGEPPLTAARPLLTTTGQRWTMEGQNFNSRHELLHEMDISKGSGNNYWRTGKEIRMG
uniref:Uncharacterized protein n=1 Tax=Tanacetum cinerariifolium TaxID=118510 RepID=A0A699KXG2_TANCI|nr:hypothetical protein [Tanacetum cinerariifolium]